MEKRSNRFFTALAPTTISLPGLTITATKLEPGALGMTKNLPIISLEDWKQWYAFHKWSVDTFNAETMIDHFITREGKILTTPFHHQVSWGAMTVHVDYTTPENAALMLQLEEQYGINSGAFHGTTHNHVKAGAFASGTDQSDETTKQGWHFTIGNLDKHPFSIDGRIRIKYNAVRDEEGELLVPPFTNLLQIEDWSYVVDIPGVDPDMPYDMRKTISQWVLTHVKDEGFPEEWKAFVTKRSYQSGTGGWEGSRFRGGNQLDDEETSYFFGGAGKGSAGGGRAVGPPASGKGGNVTSVPRSPSMNGGHLMVSGSVDSGRAEYEFAGNTIPRELYVKFDPTIKVLDIIAGHGLLRNQISGLLQLYKSKSLDTVVGKGGPFASAVSDIIDSAGGLGVQLDVIMSHIDMLFSNHAIYVWSVPLSENPGNRRVALASFMATAMEEFVSAQPPNA